jgi:AcrR family transcriptional regulator
MKRAKRVGTRLESRAAWTPPATTNQRPAQIVRAAYQLIVDNGLEGFRTRDVAAKVGINTATLHYYFPSKESLIQGVVQHLIEELKSPLVKLQREPQSAIDKLRLEFRDVSVRIRQAPDQLLVLNELAIRSWRDPSIAGILSHLDEQWRGHLVSILKQGIEEGAFRSDLNVLSTANAIMTQLRGLGLQVKLDASHFDRLVKQIAAQTEHWVLEPRKLSRRA